MTDLCQACADYPEITFETGAELLAAGKKTGRLYVLTDGEVAIVRNGIEIAIVGTPGAVFGELSLLLDQPHNANVIARRPTRARLIEDGAGFLRSSPEVIYQIARVLALRLHMLTTYLGDLKQQFADKGDDHFGMVDVIIACMTQHQDQPGFRLGSDREPGSRP